MSRHVGAKRKVTVAMVSGTMLLAGAIGGCSRMHSAESLISDAKQYHQKGDDKAAIIQLKNALQKNADDVEARLMLGRIYQDMGDPLSAEKEARKAAELGADKTRALPIVGSSLLAQGQYKKVIDELAPVQSADAEVYCLRGNAYLALSNAKAAKEAFDAALAAKADYPDALIGQAKLALLDHNLDDAMKLATRATESNPQNIDAWFFKGDLLRAQNKVDDAVVAYDKILSLKPGLPRAHIVKAQIEITQKKYDAAHADIDAAKKTSPNGVPVLYAQALLDHLEGKNTVAMDGLQQIFRAAPEYPPALLLAGGVQMALNQTQQAEQSLKKYLEIDPGNAYATKLLAAALMQNGQTDRALATINAALKKTPEDPQLLALAGEAAMKARDFTKATDYFEKASTLAPKTAQIHTALGLSKLAQGEDKRAVAELETAANLDAGSPKAGITLLMTYTRLKDYDKALAVAQTLEKDNPDNPLIPNLKGAVYLAKKDVAAARASFEKALSVQPTYVPAAANLAQLDMVDKKPDMAKKRFESILEKDKKNAQALMALAGLAVSQGKEQEATSLLERAVRDNPEEIQPAVVLGAHYLRLKDKEKALNVAQKLLPLYPSNPQVVDLLAQSQLANNNVDGAIETYRKLAALTPESGMPHLRIATLLMTQNNEAAAADALKKALLVQPGLTEARIAQIGLEVKGKRYDQALKLVRQLQQQQPRLPMAYALEGDVLMAQNQPALAVKPFDQAYAMTKSAPGFIKVHSSLLRAGRDKEASTRLDQWFKEHPDDTAVRMYIGSTNLLNQKNKVAIEQFEAVLKREPKNVVALNNIAYAYQQENDPRAIEFAEKAYGLAGESAAVLDTYGWLLVEKNQASRGVPLLQKAASLAPQAWEIRYHLAQGLARTGDKAGARKELESLLADGKKFPKADEARTLLQSL